MWDFWSLSALGLLLLLAPHDGILIFLNLLLGSAKRMDVTNLSLQRLKGLSDWARGREGSGHNPLPLLPGPEGGFRVCTAGLDSLPCLPPRSLVT